MMDEGKFCQVLALALAVPGTEVWLLTPEVGSFVDVMGNEIKFPVEDSTLFFLDYAPEANWAHTCGYCALTQYGLLYRAAEWPPGQEVGKLKL